jgi:eukaryotic-like serine/threonine-protein kinase
VIGQRINNVEIVRLLIEGGMGTIYEAEHLLMRRRFAVKVLRRELGADSALVQRFLNEARATNEIRHPNIVEVTDAGVLPSGLPYFVMELLVGENLSERLARVGPLSVGLALDLTLQTASAVHAAHQAGIVHRDLKPENLFLTADPRVQGHELVKVLDFGIAKLRGEISAVRTNAGAVLGTPAYMAPEQCRGRPDDVDHRADIYALGVILYEMLAGAPPFETPGAVDLMMMQVGTPPPPITQRRADVPAQVAAVVMRALAKDPAQRFDSLAEMMAALGHRSTPVPSVAPLQASTGTTLPGLADASVHPTETALAPAHFATRQALTAPPSAAPSGAPPATQSRGRWLPVVALLAAAVAATWLVSRRGSEEPLRPAPLAASREATALAPSSSPSAEEPYAPPPVPSSPQLLAEEPVRGNAQRPPKLRRNAAPPVATVTASAERKNPKNNAEEAEPPASPQAAPGLLTLDSSPWSQVYLAGRLLGSTPLVRVALPAGRHVLTLKNPELGSSTTYVVVIQSDKALSRFVGWGEE